LNKANELRNMLLCAEMVLRSALYRTETRGGNFREDYPFIDNENWLKWVIIKPCEDGAMELSSRPIPIESYPFKPNYSRIEHPIFAVKD
jgi:succinate dehydrogenase/fumarate reductase flavoprotein subunit